MALSRHALNLRDGLVAALRAAFPEDVVPTVAHHDGAADLGFVKRYGFVAPAIVLTILGGSCTPKGGSLFDELKVGLYIITEGDDQEQRTDEALVLREHCMRVIFGRAGDLLPDVSHKIPTKIDSENMFDGKVDELGVTIWLLAWEHVVSIPGLVAFEDLDVYRQQWVELFPPGEVPDEVETGDALAEDLIELEVAPEDELPPEEEPPP